jgi:hypothetical protein
MGQVKNEVCIAVGVPIGADGALHFIPPAPDIENFEAHAYLITSSSK